MKVLMVYFSRTGVTKKVAGKTAEALRQAGVEVEVEEILEAKDRGGFFGYLGGIWDAIRKRTASIEPAKAELAGFDLVAIGTPVWASSAATPVRTFCREHGGKAGSLAFYCTMTSSGDKGAFKAMEELCGKAPAATLALKARHVKNDDEEKFLAKVKSFVEEIASVGG